MATPPYNIPPLVPAGSDFLLQYPDQSSFFRDIIKSWLEQIADPTTGLIRTGSIPGLGDLALTSSSTVGWAAEDLPVEDDFDDLGGIGTVVAAGDGVTDHRPWDDAAVINLRREADSNIQIGFTTDEPTAPRAALRGQDTSDGTWGAWVDFVTAAGPQTIAGNKTFSDRVLTQNGDAGAPAIAPSSDTDTGIYFGGSNTILFSTAGTLRATFNASGTVTYENAVTYNSDARLKRNIGSLGADWAGAFGIHGYTYNYTYDGEKAPMRYGFMAQEVQDHYPELVHETDEQLLTLDYNGLIPVLWELVKNLHRRVVALEGGEAPDREW